MPAPHQPFPSLWNVPLMAKSLNCYLGDEDDLGSDFADFAEQLDRVNNHRLSCSRAAQAFRGVKETVNPKVICPSHSRVLFIFSVV